MLIMTLGALMLLLLLLLLVGGGQERKSFRSHLEMRFNGSVTELCKNVNSAIINCVSVFVDSANRLCAAIWQDHRARWLWSVIGMVIK